MEMETTGTGGRYGDHEQTNSISYSSSSGTIVSTQSTYTSRGSRLSSFSIEAAMHLDLEESDYCDDGEGGGTENGWRFRILLQEFLGAPAAAANPGSIKAAGVLDLERWFTELGVAWVLHLNLADDGGGASAGILEHTTSKTRSWIRALAEITETIRFTASLFTDHPSQGLLPSIFEDGEEEPEADEHRFPDQFNDIARSIQQEPDADEHRFPDQFNDIARAIQQEPDAEYYFPDQFNDIGPFIQESMSKMLSFVDIIVALDPNNTTACEESFVGNGNGVPTLYNRIDILLSVHNALSKALSKVRLVFHSPPSPQVERMTGEIVSLLSAKNRTAGDAIWSTMEQIRMESIEDGGNSSTYSEDLQAGSADIHTATRSLVTRHWFQLYLKHLDLVTMCPSVDKCLL